MAAGTYGNNDFPMCSDAQNNLLICELYFDYVFKCCIFSLLIKPTVPTTLLVRQCLTRKIFISDISQLKFNHLQLKVDLFNKIYIKLNIGVQLYSSRTLMSQLM